MKDRNGVQFRPNPMFQPKKKLSSHASDVMRDEQDKRAKESRKQELEQIEAAWKNYQKGGDLSVLIPFLRNELFSYHPMPSAWVKRYQLFWSYTCPHNMRIMGTTIIFL